MLICLLQLFPEDLQLCLLGLYQALHLIYAFLSWLRDLTRHFLLTLSPPSTGVGERDPLHREVRDFAIFSQTLYASDDNT